MAKTTYIAKFNGEIVGTRQTERTYAYAVVVIADQEFDAKRAASVEYAREHCNKKDFVYYCAIANDGVDAEQERYKYTSREEIERRVAEAAAIRDMGYDAWVEQRRLHHIAQHEQSVAKGRFKPAVATWCSRLDLALKEASVRRKPAYWGRYTTVEIVPAEVSEKKTRPVKSSIQRLRS